MVAGGWLKHTGQAGHGAIGAVLKDGQLRLGSGPGIFLPIGIFRDAALGMGMAMSWLAGSNKVNHRASFWWWQVQSRAYWILEEVEHGYCMIEGWDL